MDTVKKSARRSRLGQGTSGLANRGREGVHPRDPWLALVGSAVAVGDDEAVAEVQAGLVEQGGVALLPDAGVEVAAETPARPGSRSPSFTIEEIALRAVGSR